MTVYLPAAPKPITNNNGQVVLAADVAAPPLGTYTTLVNSGTVPAGRYLVIAQAVVTGATTPSNFFLGIAGMSAVDKWVPDSNSYSSTCSYIYTFATPSSIWLQVSGPTGATVKRLEVVQGTLGATILKWVQIA